MSTVIYICYQAAQEATVAEGYNTNILGVCDSEEKAQEICCNDGDSYTQYELNKDLGRIPEDSSDQATYNIKGNFIKGYENAIKEITNENSVFL